MCTRRFASSTMTSGQTRRYQLFMSDNLAGALCQRDQDVKRAATNGDQLLAFLELALGE